MRDKRGLYYYPFPQNKRVRMYVREAGIDIEFRLWNQDDAELWKTHGWIPYDAVKQATGIYKGGRFDPNQAYDLEVAKALLKESR